MLTDILIFVGSLVLVVVMTMLFDGHRRAMRKRIEKLKLTHKTASDLSLKRKTSNSTGLLGLLAKRLPSFTRLGDYLERANVKLSAQQYMLRRIFWVLGITFFVVVILKKSVLLGFCAGIIFGVWVPLKLLSRVINKRKKAFIQLFPNAIDLIVRGLRSGLPVSESIVLVSTEVPDPVGAVFSTISNTMKLGVTMEKSLQEMARKLDMTEFNFFTTSIVIQRETGGNLAEILNNLSEVLRGRYIMAMKIKAMSSEARASAMIIGALPFVVILAVSVVSPKYLRPLIDDPSGNTCAMVAAGMMGFGMWVMNKMTKFEI